MIHVSRIVKIIAGKSIRHSLPNTSRTSTGSSGAESRNPENALQLLDTSLDEFKRWDRFCHVVLPLDFAFSFRLRSSSYDGTRRPNKAEKPVDFCSPAMLALYKNFFSHRLYF
jgi:hypothetical protein